MKKVYLDVNYWFKELLRRDQFINYLLSNLNNSLYGIMIWNNLTEEGANEIGISLDKSLARLLFVETEIDKRWEDETNFYLKYVEIDRNDVMQKLPRILANFVNPMMHLYVFYKNVEGNEWEFTKDEKDLLKLLIKWKKKVLIDENIEVMTQAMFEELYLNRYPELSLFSKCLFCDIYYNYYLYNEKLDFLNEMVDNLINVQISNVYDMICWLYGIIINGKVLRKIV